MSVIAASRKKRPDSLIVTIVERTLLLCAIAPYALVALVVRLVLARAFFLAGQGMIDGPVVPLGFKNVDLSFTLPAQVKEATLQAFATLFAGASVSPAVIATLFAYAEFALPVCLVLGLATRYAATALLVITVLTQIYIAPGAFFTLHVYLISLLLVLMTCGAGDVSFDRLIRWAHGDFVREY